MATGPFGPADQAHTRGVFLTDREGNPTSAGSAVTVQDSVGDSAMDDANNALRVNVVAGGAGGGEVTFTGTASTANSSTAPLGIGATFTGTFEDVLKYAAVVVQFISDVAPASDGIKVDWSPDGVNVDATDSYNMAFTGVGEYRVLQMRGRYVRLRYVNGGVAQAYLRLATIFKYAPEVPSPLGGVQILDGAGGVKKALVDAGGDAEVLQNRVYVDALNRVYDGTNFKYLRGDTANGADVDVTRLPALVAGTANIGDVDVLTVPAPLSTSGGGTEAAALRVTVATDSTGVLSVDDNGGSLTIDNANLDVALSTRLKPADTLTAVTSLTQMNGQAIAMGSGVRSAGTQRVTVATDDVVPVTDNAGSLTVDAPVATPVFVRLSDGAAAQIGQKAMASSLPVVLASDQASVPVAATLAAETTKVIGTVRNLGNAGANFDAATAAAVPANGLYMGGSDGTNLRGVLTTSAANLTAATTLGAPLTPPFATWSITHRPAAATKATASKGAGAAGVRHVVTGFSFTLSTVGTAQAALLMVDIIDGASGGATRLWSGSIGGLPINSQHTFGLTGLMLIGTAATALTIEFSAAGVAASVEQVNLWGFSVS